MLKRYPRLIAVWSRNARPVLALNPISPRQKAFVALASTAASQKKYISPRIRTRNVLRSLDQLYPRIVDCSVPNNEAWKTRIRDALESLGDDSEVARSRRRTIVGESPGIKLTFILHFAIFHKFWASKARMLRN